MINGGNATVYVSNMDNAIQFYTEVLGLKLTNRFGNHWATVQAGTTLVIGLHPWSAKTRGRARKARCKLALSYRGTNRLTIPRPASASMASKSATSSNRKKLITYPSQIRTGTRSMSEIGIRNSTRSTSHTTPWVRQCDEPVAWLRRSTHGASRVWCDAPPGLKDATQCLIPRPRKPNGCHGRPDLGNQGSDRFIDDAASSGPWPGLR